MRKRKYKKALGKISIIYLSLILSLSLMGVGYAAWSSGLTINATFKTGNTDPLFYIEDNMLNKDDGELEYELSKEKDILIIKGKVYPSFKENIKIEVIDEGSIPSVYKDLEKDDSDITDIKEGKKNKYGRMATINNRSNNKDIEFFDLKIDSSNHLNEGKYSRMSMRSFSSVIDGVSGLEGEINRLKDEIRAYDQEEEYEFKYKLLFEQGL